MRPTIRRLAPLTVAACALLFAPTASATSSKTQIKASVSAAVGYLEGLQHSDGSFETDWVINSLAAAHTAAADVKLSGGTDARSWYDALVGNPTTWPPEGGSTTSTSVTEFERAALNAYAAGIDPARVSVQQNLIARIIAEYQTANPGYFGTPAVFSGTIFAMLALGETKTTGGARRVPQALLDKATSVLAANQHSDGGWTFQRAEGNPTRLAEPSEPDETGAALAALCSAGLTSANATVAGGVHFLEADELADGSFNAEFGVNTDSNAWGVQGLNACGIDSQGASFTTASGHTPVDFLISQQRPGGGFVFAPGEPEPFEYESQDALRSLAGAGFTAAPPKPKTLGAPKWIAASAFVPGTPSQVSLVIDDGKSLFKPCAVTLSPSATTTTLLAVLQAAKAGSSPAGCVTSFAPSAGKGALTEVDGSAGAWQLSIDGGKSKVANVSTKIGVGATISLAL
jgi:hypothetical protein